MYALATRLLLAGINKPTIITFHGTDIHAKTIRTTKSLKGKVRIRLNQWASFFSFFMFEKLGFVAEDMLSYVPNFITLRDFINDEINIFIPPFVNRFDTFNN